MKMCSVKDDTAVGCGYTDGQNKSEVHITVSGVEDR
jgi:hypothetical protein